MGIFIPGVKNEKGTVMLTQEQGYVLYLLKKSLGVISDNDPGYNVTAKTVENVIIQSGIILTVYGQLPQDMKKDLEELYYKTVKQSVLQKYEGERILGALGGAGFECIALKGWELGKLYPGSVMRQMADLDILVRPYEYDKIKKIMQSLGYSSGDESSWMHDNFTKNEITVEMHKRMTDDSGQIREWEETVWDRAERNENNVCRMATEDVYIFHYIHLYKDFKNGSFGLRRVVDGWLLQKQEFDKEFADKELEKLGLKVFAEKMINFSRACMGEIPFEADHEILLNHAFKHGINGSDRSYKAGRIASMSDKSMKRGKVRSFLSAVFLPFSRMKAQFPVLQRWPVLLPFCWIIRIFSLLRHAKEHVSKLDYRNIDEKDYNEMKEFFRAGGIS